MFSAIMTIINISSLILVAIGYFREHYTIVDLETWNEIVHFYNENHTEVEEQAGGVGFYIPTNEECLYSEDEEDASIGNNKKVGF